MHEELHKVYKEDLGDRDAGGMIGAGWGSQGWDKDGHQTEQYNNVTLLQTGSVKEAVSDELYIATSFHVAF